MPLQKNEIAINKSCSVDLGNNKLAIIAHVYHTADRKAYPEDRSWYKYVGRVVDTSSLDAEIQDKKSSDHRLEDWKWESPAWPTECYFSYDEGHNKAKESRWLKMKLKKALSWDAYLKLVKDGIKTIASTGKEKRYAGGAYETEAYQDADGNLYNITSKEDLLKLENKTFWKDCILKRSLPKNPPKN